MRCGRPRLHRGARQRPQADSVQLGGGVYPQAQEVRGTAGEAMGGNIMKGKGLRRMVGWRKGDVAVITVQYEDGTVESVIFDRSEAA